MTLYISLDVRCECSSTHTSHTSFADARGMLATMRERISRSDAPWVKIDIHTMLDYGTAYSEISRGIPSFDLAETALKAHRDMSERMIVERGRA